MNNKVNFLRGTSAEYESSIKDNDTFYYTTDTKKLYLGETEITGGGVIIDDALSSTSEHPVQNKIITEALDGKAAQSHTHSEATADTAGFLSASDKSKLDGIAESADSVSFTGSLSSGTKIGTIKINDTSTSIYAPTNTDTKVTNTLNTTAKAYITGTTSSSTNTGTQVFDTGVYLDTTAGTLTATTFKGALSGNASSATKVNGHTVEADVPSDAVFTDTVYTHPTTTSITGTPTANQTPAFGGTFTVNQVSRDTNGHVSDITSRTITIPSTAASTSSAGLVTTGTQTFAGDKTLQGNSLSIQDKNWAFGSAPSSTVAKYIKFCANGGTGLTDCSNIIYNQITTTGVNRLKLRTADALSSSPTASGNYIELIIQTDVDGDKYAYLNGTNLATKPTTSALRNLASGTAEATWDTSTKKGTCPVGSWYGKYN